jgi:uncharacterized protein (DUF885 family)
MSVALDKLVERYLREMVEASPIAGTYLGLHEGDGELGDFSREAIEEEHGHRTRLLSDLDGLSLEGASADAKADAVILRTALRGAIFEHEVLRHHERRPADYVQSALGGCNLLLIREFAPLAERAHPLLSRLRQVPQVLAAMRENVKDPPRVFTTIAREAALGGVAFIRSVVPRVIEEVPDLGPELDEAATTAAGAFEEAAEYLAGLEEGPDVPFHVGRENYEWLLNEIHLLDMDSDDLLEFGGKILAETKERLAEVAKEIDPNRDWHEIMEEIKRDHPAKDELRERYASEMARARDFVREKGLVTIPEGESLEVVDTPVFLRTILPYAAYMPAGPFDAQQKGLFYVTPADESLSPDDQERQLRGHGSHTIPVIALHEGYPGHHLQITRSNLGTRMIRKLTWSTVFGEGWALYCEEMMRETGFYTDPVTRLCQLKENLWRAARVVVDVGLSRGEMTIDEAIQFMMDEVTLERVNATAEVKRYTGSPTQPSSYMVGKHAILSIRRRYEEKAGASFDLAEFHDRLLDLGNIQPRLAETLLGLRESETI